MKHLTLVTASGEEHGMIKQLANSVQGDGFQHMTPEAKAEAQRKKKEDSRLVKARYLNSRGKGERLSKPYCRNAGEPIQFWKFIPGQVYEIPKGLIDEVNAVKNMVRADLLDEDGKPRAKDEEEAPLHQFVPVGF